MEKKISLWFICSALLLLSGCEKNHTPAEEETPVPVGFRAMSQAAIVSGDSQQTKAPLSEYQIDRFGVWGIATEPTYDPYILWDDSVLTEVAQVSGSNVYVPVEDAFWFTGYTYDFLALAPYESGVTGLKIDKNLSGTPQTADPSVSFTFDMAQKYGETYLFDLLGAAAHAGPISQKPTEQPLTFWHLFSKININVIFVNASGAEIKTDVPEVKRILLRNIRTKADYEFSYNPSSDDNLSVSCDLSPYDALEDLEFTGPRHTFHIIPQNIGEFKMYIDFDMKENGQTVTFTDYEINLFPTSGIPKDYQYNSQYNWNIKISPKAEISFDVEVNPWTITYVSDGDSDSNDEIEII